MRMRRLATLLAVSIAVTAVPVSAQEDAPETPSTDAVSNSQGPGATSPKSTMPAKELGGVWRRILRRESTT